MPHVIHWAPSKQHGPSIALYDRNLSDYYWCHGLPSSAPTVSISILVAVHSSATVPHHAKQPPSGCWWHPEPRSPQQRVAAVTAVALVLVMLVIEFIQRRQIAHCLNSQLRCNHWHWQAKFLSRLQHRLSVIPTSPPPTLPSKPRSHAELFSSYRNTTGPRAVSRTRHDSMGQYLCYELVNKTALLDRSVLTRDRFAR